MATPEELARQAEAVAMVRAVRIERDRVTRELNERFRQAVLDALATGAATNDVAAAAEISRQRVFQISRGD